MLFLKHKKCSFFKKSSPKIWHGAELIAAESSIWRRRWTSHSFGSHGEGRKNSRWELHCLFSWTQADPCPAALLLSMTIFWQVHFERKTFQIITLMAHWFPVHFNFIPHIMLRLFLAEGIFSVAGRETPKSCTAPGCDLIPPHAALRKILLASFASSYSAPEMRA